MDGSQHYRTAERLLAAAKVDLLAGKGMSNLAEHDRQVAQAQVHVGLAQVAATIDAANAIRWNYPTDGSPGEVANSSAWREAIQS